MAISSSRSPQQRDDAFRRLLDILPEAILIHCNRTIVYVNKACMALLAAASPEQLLGREISTVVPPDEMPIVEKRIETHYRIGGTLPAMEHTLKTLDGSLVEIEVVATPCDWNGCPAIEVVLRDIRDRKRAQQAAHQWQQRLELAQKSGLKIGLWDWDVVNNTVIWSHETYRQFGYDLDTFTGKVDEPLARIHPDDLPRVKVAIQKVVDGAQDYAAQYRVVHPDGTTYWIDARGVAVRNGSTHMVGVGIDITERALAEQQLRESEKKFRSIIENAPYGIYRSTADGTIVSANPALARMLGYETVQEVLSLNLLHDVYRRPEQRAPLIAEVLERGRSVNAELEWKRKDGTPFTVRADGIPVVNEKGETEGFQVFVEDVTESKQLERKFWQVQKLEAVGRLAGGVAHDFNNVLMIVSSYADLLLQRNCMDEKSVGYAKQIHQAALRAATVTQQLLAFSRKQILEPEVLDPNTVLKDLGKMLPKLLGEDIKLVLDPDPAISRIKVDRGQLEQIIMNLSVNARDAMPKGGRLTIRTRNVTLDGAFAREHPSTIPGSYVLLSVSDSGLGMDAETKAMIFEPFFTTKERGKGTGLGLATVYGIVKQSGGFIWVNSEPGEGSSFDIYLPTVNAPLPLPAKPYVPDLRLRGSERILLVEDEEQLLAATSEFLQRSGYSVLTARSGLDALRAAESQSGTIDLLLTDVIMPEIDGVELARTIRRNDPHVRVLYMSGYSDRTVEGLGEGTLLLRKPFSQQLLAGKIREVLASPVSTSVAQN